MSQIILDDHKCEYCNGTVSPRLMEREVFKHKKGFVILENVVIGVCDGCGDRYYSADILHTVHEIATGRRQPERTEAVPVAYAGQAGALIPA
ncbi:MAG: YgiT-type zinc finger protein [Anaerolineae bacterium]